MLQNIQALKRVEIETGRSSFHVIDHIYSEDIIRKSLTDIYKELNLDKIARATDIHYYFDAKRRTVKKNPKEKEYILFRRNYKSEIK